MAGRMVEREACTYEGRSRSQFRCVKLFDPKSGQNTVQQTLYVARSGNVCKERKCLPGQPQNIDPAPDVSDNITHRALGFWFVRRCCKVTSVWTVVLTTCVFV